MVVREIAAENGCQFANGLCREWVFACLLIGLTPFFSAATLSLQETAWPDERDRPGNEDEQGRRLRGRLLDDHMDGAVAIGPAPGRRPDQVSLSVNNQL
jgi:hypothetical protein